MTLRTACSTRWAARPSAQDLASRLPGPRRRAAAHRAPRVERRRARRVAAPRSTPARRGRRGADAVRRRALALRPRAAHRGTGGALPAARGARRGRAALRDRRRARRDARGAARRPAARPGHHGARHRRAHAGARGARAARVRLASGAELPAGGARRAGSSRWATERVPTVDDVAQFSVRGGILDVYGFGMADPARLEFWGDEISSLRRFDLTSQRSQAELGRSGRAARWRAAPTTATAMRRADAAARRCSSCCRPTRSSSRKRTGPMRTRWQRTWDEAAHHLDLARRRGEDVPAREEIFEDPRADGGPRSRAFARLRPARRPRRRQMGFFPPERSTATSSGSAACWRGTPRRSSSATTRASASVSTSCSSRRRRAGHRRARRSRSACSTAASSCPTLPRPHRPRDLPPRAPPPPRAPLPAGARSRRSPRSSPATSSCTSSTASGSTAASRRSSSARARVEVAVIEYEGGDRLNVPLYRIDQIERYRSARDVDDDAPPPRLHKLGGKRWAQQRDKTRAGDPGDDGRAARPLRAAQGRGAAAALPPDTRVAARSSSRRFLFEDTPDQRKATDGREDATWSGRARWTACSSATSATARPRSRCAPRSRRCSRSEQVAVLVPTTILAEQHARTFGERLADFPDPRRDAEPLPDGEGAGAGARRARGGERSTS